MRFIEIAKLNDYICNAKELLQGNVSSELFQEIDKLEAISLQHPSIAEDRKFLKSVNALLNVVVTIINHPHISNKREEVIIRVELAQQIGEEAFRNTIKDSSLWKKHNIRMIPEEVYYYQHEDELKIYENRFIVFLVGLIDKELARFSNFYLSRLPSLAHASELDDGQIGDTVLEIDRLRRKISFIKNTHFYKVISKEKPISHKIVPTNILLKDRLYQFCFKFYRNFTIVEDRKTVHENLRLYYLILLLKRIKKEGFECISHAEDAYTFQNDAFSLVLHCAPEAPVTMQVTWKHNPTYPMEHLLDVYVESDRALFEGGDADGVNAERISLWELCRSEDRALVPFFTGSEEELISHWLTQKLTVLSPESSVHEKYCPVCKSKDTDFSDRLFVCRNCLSEYAAALTAGTNQIWFRTIRK